MPLAPGQLGYPFASLVEVGQAALEVIVEDIGMLETLVSIDEEDVLLAVIAEVGEPAEIEEDVDEIGTLGEYAARELNEGAADDARLEEL